MSDPTDMTAEVIVEAGAIVALRLFDIAYAIDLAAAEAAWAARTQSGTRRSRLNASPAKAIAFDVPPVMLALDPLPLQLAGGSVTAQVSARVYDFGVVAFALRIEADELRWSAFADRLESVQAAVGPASTTLIWSDLLDRVRGTLAPALIKPSEATLQDSIQEDYLLGIVHRLAEPLSAEALQARVDLVPLLSGERRALSDGARRDLLRKRFSYYEDDLVVLTWDRAFIYEPSGDSDVADVIEVANAQLLELRYYDELLDDELPRMNDLVDQTRNSLGIVAPRRFAKLARRLYTLVAEVTELTEKVDNALQVTEDVYLARIYSAALELFRVPSVSAAVDRKLSIIRDTYTALYDESSGARGALMEFAIVMLIVIEVVLALVRH
ncbi:MULTISPECIES: hypothetical protein [Hydrocarboniphaga]|uniref:DUF155 domain-containing protein n=1 Tax=Hydrocarboniphaga effusa AP103 TaxID=1172194 RepID=I7ZIC6_9GAMM|nr:MULTISPECIES: hypothetical protein [Hydrocarboniphaga]EIT71462.1 hypothetical protein WQQ_15990 [Hydrocarboniphaga effusa AP103]MDZ4079309.1 hypothetical protein [Hydrocarboniphaga sp.]